MAALGVLTAALSGCALVNPQAGPLALGHGPDIWGTNSYCVPREVFDEPFYLGDRASNPTGEPITLTGIELDNPKGVQLVASGVAPVNQDADGFMAGNRDLADPEMPWPELSAEPLHHTLSPGEEVTLIVEVEPTTDRGTATVDRLKMSYRAGDWDYTERSGTSFQWVQRAAC